MVREKTVKKHRSAAKNAVIGRKAQATGDAVLLSAIGLADVAHFADLAGTGQLLALAAYARWGCDISLVDLDPRGKFSDHTGAWVAPYRTFLAANGVPEGKVRVISDLGELGRVDVIANLSGFGDVNRIKPIEPVLSAALHGGSQMILDIRTGSGGYPFLRRFGACETISQREEDGGQVTRVLFRSAGSVKKVAEGDPLPAVLAGSGASGWADVARGLAGKDGFYRENPEHSFLYIPRGDTLVVTFDNLDIAMTKREDRRPWGFSFIEKQGWSMLGVMANGWTWYRDGWVCDQFDDLAKSGFFKGFKRVVFYGASMGGYAACAFVAACPGADVVAISPQSTLDRRLVPFETRYKTAWGRDFSGKYGDAAEASKAAGRVTILYDPYEPLDAGHVARFTGANVVALRAPLMGHRLGSSLHQMGILSAVTLGALNGTLTEADFYKVLRARKGFVRYQRELFKRALAKGHPALARKLGRFVLTRGTNRYIRKAMEAM